MGEHYHDYYSDTDYVLIMMSISRAHVSFLLDLILALKFYSLHVYIIYIYICGVTPQQTKSRCDNVVTTFSFGCDNVVITTL